MPSTSSIRFLAVLLLVGVAGVTPARSASAEVPFSITLRQSLLATEALGLSEEVELKWVRPAEPDTVTRMDERRALRGRLLLAAAALGSIAASTIILTFGMNDLISCWSS